jgi:hypothetical protein
MKEGKFSLLMLTTNKETIGESMYEYMTSKKEN